MTMRVTYVPPIRRVDTEKTHYYVDGAGNRVKGVTTIIDQGVPKPALIEWSSKATAECAINNWDDLADMPPAARLYRLQRGKYETTDLAKNRGTEIHAAAEDLAAGKEVTVPDEIAGQVEQYA